MSYKMVRLRPSTGLLIDSLVTKYSYKNNNDCIADMANFFIENGLSPTTNLNLQIHKEIADLNTAFKKRDDTFRKWFGEITNKKMVNMMNQVTEARATMETVLTLISEDYKADMSKRIAEENRQYAEEKAKENNAVNTAQKDNSSKIDLDAYYRVLDQKEAKIKDLKSKISYLVNKAKKQDDKKGTYAILLSQFEIDTLKAI